MIIEIVNQETVIDVNGETFTAEVLVTNYSDELIAQYALEAQQAAQEAEANATIATNQAIIATNQALLASAARLNAQNAADAAEASEDAAALSAASAVASEQASAISESNAIISASNALASEQAANLDAIATAADRVQTGLDRIATGADRVQTGIDANTATVQAGIATTQAGNALTSANNAAVSASTAASAALNTPLTGFASGANTIILPTDTTLQAFGKTQGQISERIGGTVGAGQVAFGTGTKLLGGDNGLFWDNTNKRLGVGTNASLLYPLTIKNTSSAFAVFDIANGVNDFGGFRFQINSFDRYTAAFKGNVANLIFSRFNASGVYQGDNLTLFNSTGNVSITGSGLATDAGFRLDVNGTARVQGNATITGNLIVDTDTLFVDATNNRVGIGSATPSATLEIINVTSVSAGFPIIASLLAPNTPNNSGVIIRIGKNSTLNASFTWDNSLNAFYFQTFSNLYDFEFQGRNNIFNPTTSSIFKSNITISDAKNIILNTTTGTKIGTATSQKLSFWNATPNVQPTTAITAGAFVSNTSAILNDTATFDGYTMGQVVAALRRIGALA
jgi:hypothetical protein